MNDRLLQNCDGLMTDFFCGPSSVKLLFLLYIILFMTDMTNNYIYRYYKYKYIPTILLFYYVSPGRTRKVRHSVMSVTNLLPTR